MPADAWSSRSTGRWPTPEAGCSRPRPPSSSSHRLARRGGPPPVRPPQHRAVPTATDRRRLRAGAHRTAGRLHAAGRPDAGAARQSARPPRCRIPTNRLRSNLVGGRYRITAPIVDQGGHVLVIVAPGQGAQTPGFLTPWLELARLRGPTALALRLRQPRPRRTTAPRPTPRRSATPRSPSRCSWRPGWCRCSACSRTPPTPSAWSASAPVTPSVRSPRPPRPASSPPSRRWSSSASAATPWRPRPQPHRRA